MKSALLKNSSLSVPFRIELARREHRKYLFKETLSMIILLYAHQLDQGIRRISDYSDMDSKEFNRELLIRTMITEGQIRSKKERHKKKIEHDTNNLLEALKNSKK